MERYRPWKTYDAVVFVKIMTDAAYHQAVKLKQKGTPIIFDANVNYYERWGSFPVPGTEPTAKQQEQAVRLTRLADCVVADSSYLKTVCEHWNANVVWIPDAVDTQRYRPTQKSQTTPKTRLVAIWSGVGKKALHLEMIEPVLRSFEGRIQLLLVPGKSTPEDPTAAVVDRLSRTPGNRVVRWGEQPFSDLLKEADIILSPKYLESSYEMGHTEYKISLGMAAGLPAIASPQPSYLDALATGGGKICRTPDEWAAAFHFYLSDHKAHQADGLRARQIIESRYAIPVVAQQYEDVLQSVCGS